MKKENSECFTPARLRRNPEKKIIFENNSSNEPGIIFVKKEDIQQKNNSKCFTPARLRRNPEKQISIIERKLHHSGVGIGI
jgi:hypothetical protein